MCVKSVITETRMEKKIYNIWVHKHLHMIHNGKWWWRRCCYLMVMVVDCWWWWSRKYYISQDHISIFCTFSLVFFVVVLFFTTFNFISCFYNRISLNGAGYCDSNVHARVYCSSCVFYVRMVIFISNHVLFSI